MRLTHRETWNNYNNNKNIINNEENGEYERNNFDANNDINALSLI